MALRRNCIQFVSICIALSFDGFLSNVLATDPKYFDLANGKCDVTQFYCDSACILLTHPLRCDGTVNCLTGWDEMCCGYPGETLRCKPGQYPPTTIPVPSTTTSRNVDSTTNHLPSTISTTHTPNPSTTTIISLPEETSTLRSDKIIVFTFHLDGDCSNVIGKELAFKEAFKASLAQKSEISSSYIDVGKISCGSVIVEFNIEDPVNTDYTNVIHNFIHKDGLKIQFESYTYTTTKIDSKIVDRTTYFRIETETKNEEGSNMILYGAVGTLLAIVIVGLIAVLVVYAYQKVNSNKSPTNVERGVSNLRRDIYISPEAMIAEQMAYRGFEIPRPRSIYADARPTPAAPYVINGHDMSFLLSNAAQLQNWALVPANNNRKIRHDSASSKGSPNNSNVKVRNHVKKYKEDYEIDNFEYFRSNERHENESVGRGSISNSQKTSSQELGSQEPSLHNYGSTDSLLPSISDISARYCYDNNGLVRDETSGNLQWAMKSKQRDIKKPKFSMQAIEERRNAQGSSFKRKRRDEIPITNAYQGNYYHIKDCLSYGDFEGNTNNAQYKYNSERNKEKRNRMENNSQAYLHNVIASKPRRYPEACIVRDAHRVVQCNIEEENGSNDEDVSKMLDTPVMSTIDRCQAWQASLPIVPRYTNDASTTSSRSQDNFLSADIKSPCNSSIYRRMSRIIEAEDSESESENGSMVSAFQAELQAEIHRRRNRKPNQLPNRHHSAHLSRSRVTGSRAKQYRRDVVMEINDCPERYIQNYSPAISSRNEEGESEGFDGQQLLRAIPTQNTPKLPKTLQQQITERSKSIKRSNTFNFPGERRDVISPDNEEIVSKAASLQSEILSQIEVMQKRQKSRHHYPLSGNASSVGSPTHTSGKNSFSSQLRPPKGNELPSWKRDIIMRKQEKTKGKQVSDKPKFCKIIPPPPPKYSNTKSSQRLDNLSKRAKDTGDAKVSFMTSIPNDATLSETNIGEANVPSMSKRREFLENHLQNVVASMGIPNKLNSQGSFRSEVKSDIKSSNERVVMSVSTTSQECDTFSTTRSALASLLSGTSSGSNSRSDQICSTSNDDITGVANSSDISPPIPPPPPPPAALASDTAKKKSFFRLPSIKKNKETPQVLQIPPPPPSYPAPPPPAPPPTFSAKKRSKASPKHRDIVVPPPPTHPPPPPPPPPVPIFL